MINNISRAFKSECLKLKGSGIVWIILIMSLIIPFIVTIGSIVFEQSFKDISQNQWTIFVNAAFMGFTGFFYPIFLVLLIVNICQTEFKHGGWKLIETQPIHRVYLYTGKFLVAITLSLICLLLFLFFSITGGLIFSLFNSDDVLLQQSIPLFKLLSFVIRLWIAGFGIMAIQYVLSISISSFIIPFIVGFISIIISSILSGFNIANWLPYTAPSQTMTSFEGSMVYSWLMHQEKLSIAWALLFLWIGYQYFSRKEWLSVFFKPFSQVLKFLLIIVCFVISFKLIEKSFTLKKHQSTVIAGEISSSDTTHFNEVLLRKNTGEILQSIPVVNNKFHQQLNNAFELGEYFLTYGKNKFGIIFSTNDSLYCKIILNKFSSKSNITGTRIAENELYFLRENLFAFNSDDYYLTNNIQEYSANDFAEKIVTAINSNHKKIDAFKTSDNIKPADDFIVMFKKLKSIKYLTLLNIEYPRMYKLYHPNEKLVYPKSINQIQSTISYSDSSLVQFNTYIDYLSQLFRSNQNIRTTNYTPALFNYINQNIKNASIKNALLKKEISEAISIVRDSAERNFIVNEYSHLITNKNFVVELISKNRLQNSLQRGKIAPDFSAESLVGDTISLKNFQGRFVMLDVWATWCKPCLQESPYFDNAADKYVSENLAFISLSVDEDRLKWKSETGDKSKSILQLRALNIENFMSAYGIEAIPRFILINPQGRIININTARPSEDEFENLIEREVLKQQKNIE